MGPKSVYVSIGVNIPLPRDVPTLHLEGSLFVREPLLDYVVAFCDSH